MRSRLGLIYAKIETTYGTDSTPTGALNAVPVYNVKLTPKHGSNKRDDLFISKSNLKNLRGESQYDLSFDCELKGSGTAGTPPKGLDDLLKACDFSETTSAGVSVTYAPNSGALKSCTIYLYIDGARWVLTGCVGDAEIAGTAGKVAMIKFKMNALYATPTDQALPAAPTFDTTVPAVLKNLTATFDGYAAVIREFSLKMNNKLVTRGDLTAINGIRGFDIESRDPSGEITVEATLIGTHNFYTKFEADTVQVLSIVIGSAAGNICTITANQCHLENIPVDDSSGILVHKLPFQMARSSADDELSLVLT